MTALERLLGVALVLIVVLLVLTSRQRLPVAPHHRHHRVVPAVPVK